MVISYKKLWKWYIDVTVNEEVDELRSSLRTL